MLDWPGTLKSREIGGKPSVQCVGSVCRFSGSPRARPEHVSAARSMQSQAGEMWHHMALSTSWLPHMMKTWIGPPLTGSGSGFIDEFATPKQVSISSAMVVRLCERKTEGRSRRSALAVGCGDRSTPTLRLTQP